MMEKRTLRVITGEALKKVGLRKNQDWFGRRKKCFRALFLTIVLSAGMCMSTMVGVVQAAGYETGVSDTEHFIHWYSKLTDTWLQNDSHQSVIEADDGSYVVVGYTSPVAASLSRQHAYITKFNKNGSIAWERAFGGGIDGLGTVTPAANYKFLKVIQLANGDYLAVGSTNDNLGMSKAGFLNFFVVRIDNDGNTKWQKTYGLKDKLIGIEASGALENEDGTLSVWGSHTYNYPEIIELRLTAEGNLLEEFLITGGNMKYVSGMIKTKDEGSIAYQSVFLNDRWSDAIVKLNPLGQLDWEVRFFPNESSTDYAKSSIGYSKIIELSDGYLIAGITKATNRDGVLKNALMTYKLDLTGKLLWTKLYQDLTYTDYVANLDVAKTSSDDVILSVTNGASPNEFVAVKVFSSDGSVSWVKSYGNKVGFERSYGGNTAFKILENSSGQIIGMGRENYITKIAGDGSIAFSTDEFIVQDNTNYLVSNMEMTQSGAGFFEKHPYVEDIVMQKDVSMLTTYSSSDGRVVAEGAVEVALQSLAITTPANKLSYQIGETLDISGLMVTGTYSDGTTKTETITTANVSGFDSSATAVNQLLTITLNGKTTTYVVQISGGTEPGEPGVFVAFLGQDPAGNYYEYNAKDLSNAYLAYQINPTLPSARMYQQFLNSKCQIVALKDLTKGYMDYSAAATASLMAQIKGEAFDINAYFGSSDAKQFAETVDNVKIVDKDGNVS